MSGNGLADSVFSAAYLRDPKPLSQYPPWARLAANSHRYGVVSGRRGPSLLGEIPAPRGGNHGTLCVHPPSPVCGARRCGLGHPLVLAPILRAHHLPDHALPLWSPRPVGRSSMPCTVWRELPRLPGADRAVLAPGVVAEASSALPSSSGEVPSPPWGSSRCSSVQAWPWASPCVTILAERRNVRVRHPST
jgi:hypothetical protein